MLEELWTEVEKECGKYSVRKYRAMISLSNENDDDDPKTRSLKREAALSTYVTKMLLYSFFAAICFVVGFIYINKKKEEENAGSSSPTVTPTSVEPEDNDENVVSEEILKLLLYLPSAGFFAGLVGTSIKFLAKVVPEALRNRGTQILNKARRFETHTRRDFSEETGFMGEVKEEVEYLFDFLRNHHVDDDDIRKKRPIRLVLFVDDLDRCPKNTIMKVLESVILLLADSPITCYLAIDTRLIVASIDEYYGSIFTNAGLDGYKFLEKIIQIPFSLPDIESVHKKDFLMKLLESKELSPFRVYKRVKYLTEAMDIPFFQYKSLKFVSEETDETCISLLIQVLRLMIYEGKLFTNEKKKSDAKNLLQEVEETELQVYSGSDRKQIALRDTFLHFMSTNIEVILKHYREAERIAAEPAAAKTTVANEPNNNKNESDKPDDKAHNASIDKVGKTIDGVSVDEEAAAASEVAATIAAFAKAAAVDAIAVAAQAAAAKVAATTNEINNKNKTYEQLFKPLATDLEFKWFQGYSEYFVGSPRKMKRIANSYIIARVVASKLSSKKNEDILIFQKKLLQFTILLEQWPCRMSWILLIVENFEQEPLNEGDEVPEIGESLRSIFKKLLKKDDTNYSDCPLIEIYRLIVKVLIHSSIDSENQLSRDGDPQIFEKILGEVCEGKRLVVNDISRTDTSPADTERGEYSLKQYAFSLPRHEIKKGKIFSIINEHVMVIDISSLYCTLFMRNKLILYHDLNLSLT